MKARLSLMSLPLMLCALATTAAASEVSGHQLLSGEALFSKTIDVSDLPDPGILELDDTMRAFVAEQIAGTGSDRERLRRLLNGMIESGLLSLDYNQVETKTAKQTFYDRVGNCISFTNLFVAMGREAGLDVSYQTVEIPPLWSSESDLIILNNHINVAVYSSFGGRLIVDFNIPEFKGNYESYPVSDDHAFALYHNNLAMDALTKGDEMTSFRYLKKSILLDPFVAGPWVNLGVLYSRNNLPVFAIAAYKRGLKIDRGNRSALTNLAHLYRSQGNERMANRYAKKIRAYQRRNPYFHYYRARSAFENDNMDEAVESLDRAIRLKDTEHQFFHLMGQINFKLGKQQEALDSFVEARRLAGFESAQEKYDQKIALLTGAQP